MHTELWFCLVAIQLQLQLQHQTAELQPGSWKRSGVKLSCRSTLPFLDSVATRITIHLDLDDNTATFAFPGPHGLEHFPICRRIMKSLNSKGCHQNPLSDLLCHNFVSSSGTETHRDYLPGKILLSCNLRP